MDKYERAQIQHRLINRLLTVRDALRPVVDGEIERGHCPAGERAAYGGVPGTRKTTLADARRIAKHAAAAIDQAVDEFDEAMRKDDD